MALVQEKMPHMLKVLTFDCPMLSLKRREGRQLHVDVPHAFVDPLEFFSKLQEHHPAQFAKQFLGSAGPVPPGMALQRFWSQVPSSDPRKQHLVATFSQMEGIVSESDIWSRAVPIALHGDAVPLGKTSLDTISWSGVYMHTMPTLDFKILLSCLVSRCKGPSSEATLWKVIVWALNALMSGRWPARDYEGQPYTPGTVEASRAGRYYAGGLFCVLWSIKADMDYLANNLYLQHSSGRMKCPWCLANTFEDPDDEFVAAFDLPVAPWNDIGVSAVWRETVWQDKASWLAFQGGLGKVHPLFCLPAVSILNVQADVMHIVCLGVAHHVLGNTMFELCFLPKYFPGQTTAQARCDELWRRIADQYRARGTPTQMSNLAIAFFCNMRSPHMDYPVLTSRVKAAETRHLVPIMSTIWANVCDRSGHDAHVLAVLQHLERFYNILDTPGYCMPAADQTSFEQSVAKILRHYRALCLAAVADGVNRWHEVPKFHYLWHIAQQSRVVNPRWSWCYPDEDFMRVVKLIGQKCMDGTATTKVAGKVVEKWLVGILWRHRCREL